MLRPPTVPSVGGTFKWLSEAEKWKTGEAAKWFTGERTWNGGGAAALQFVEPVWQEMKQKEDGGSFDCGVEFVGRYLLRSLSDIDDEIEGVVPISSARSRKVQQKSAWQKGIQVNPFPLSLPTVLTSKRGKWKGGLQRWRISVMMRG